MRMLILGLDSLSYSVAYQLGKEFEIVVVTNDIPPSHPVKRYYYNDLVYMKTVFAKVDPLNEPDRLRYLMKISDVVVNFISVFGKDENEMMKANYEAPKSLVNVLKDVNPDALFIHISTFSLGQKSKHVEEEYPHGTNMEPGNAFEKSKLMGEKEVMKADIRKVILRPTVVYGITNAYKHFVETYKFAKRGIIPGINVKIPTVDVRYLASVIKILANERPKSDYFYVTECEKVSMSDILDLYCEALNKRCVKIPVLKPALDVMKRLYPEAGVTLKYSDYEFSCKRTKEILGDITFIKEDIIENAKFLRYLETQDELVPE